MHSVPRVVECIEQAEPTVELATPVKDEGDVTEKLLPAETRSPVIVACGTSTAVGDGGEKLSPTSTNSQDAVLHAPLTSAASMSIKELSEEEEDAAASEPLVRKQSEQERGDNEANVVAAVHRGSGDSAASESAPKSVALSLPADTDLLSMSGSESGISNSGTPGAAGVVSSAASPTPTAATTAATSTAGTNSLTVAEAPERSRRKLSVQGE